MALHRLGITQHLINSGIARLEEIRNAEGHLENAYVRVDREKVLSHGKEASGKLLVELQVRKSTADGAGAREYYTNLTKPSDHWAGEIRDLVLKKKLVRCDFLSSWSGRLKYMSLAASQSLCAAQHCHCRRRGSA
jgi:dipeptidyl-peptidase III